MRAEGLAAPVVWGECSSQIGGWSSGPCAPPLPAQAPADKETNWEEMREPQQGQGTSFMGLPRLCMHPGAGRWIFNEPHLIIIHVLHNLPI